MELSEINSVCHKCLAVLVLFVRVAASGMRPSWMPRRVAAKATSKTARCVVSRISYTLPGAMRARAGERDIELIQNWKVDGSAQMAVSGLVGEPVHLGRAGAVQYNQSFVNDEPIS